MKKYFKYAKNYQKEILVVLAVSVILLAKLFITSEIALKDEAQYISTALRFVQGDIMLIHEWSVVQTSSFLLMPFWWIWNLFSPGSTEGVMLYFRIIYLLFKLIVFLYSLYLTKDSEFKKYAFYSGLIFYCFSPQNIDALSYNTIGLAMIYLVILLILRDKGKKTDYIWCGILFSMAVFVQPYNLFLYMGYFLLVIIIAILKKFNKKLFSEDTDEDNMLSSYFTIKGFLWFTLGPVILVLLMLLYFGVSIKLNGLSFNELLTGLQNTLNEPDHVSDISFIATVKQKFVHNIDTIIKEYKFVTIINSIWIVVLIVGRFLKKNFSIGTLVVLSLSCIWIGINEKSFPMNLMFIVFLWFTIEELLLIKKVSVNYYICMVLAFAYSLCVTLGTNTGTISASAAMAELAFMDIIMWSFVKDDYLINRLAKNDEKIIKVAETGLMGIIIMVVLSLHSLICWTDIWITNDYSEYIEKGPLKGTYTKASVKENYDNVLSDMDEIKCSSDDILLCTRTVPVAYLYTKAEVGVMAVYFFNMNYEWLQDYYELNPDKKPTVVYYPEITKKEKQKDFFAEIEKYYDVIYPGKRVVARKICEEN